MTRNREYDWIYVAAACKFAILYLPWLILAALACYWMFRHVRIT